MCDSSYKPMYQLPDGVDNIPKDSVLTLEQGLCLTEFYVRYFYFTGRFYTLTQNYSLEDIVNELAMKFHVQRLFEKYDSSITTKKYHVMRSVQRSMIDMLRKHRDTISLDAVIETDGDLTLMDTLTDGNSFEDMVIGSVEGMSVLQSLPSTTTSKVIGDSPVLGRCSFTYQNVAIHLAMGFTPAQISRIYFNPDSGRPVTSGRVNRMVYEMREKLRPV